MIDPAALAAIRSQSAVGRTVPEGNGLVLPSAIQTSAEINPGNSGGALANLNGAVIGIPNARRTEPEFGGAQAPGIGFAIPSNTVNRIAGKLISSGKGPQRGRAFLGVTVPTASAAASSSRPSRPAARPTRRAP